MQEFRAKIGFHKKEQSRDQSLKDIPDLPGQTQDPRLRTQN